VPSFVKIPILSILFLATQLEPRKFPPRNVFNGKANKFLMFTAFIHVIEYNIYLGKKSKGVNVAVFSSVSYVAVEVK